MISQYNAIGLPGRTSNIMFGHGQEPSAGGVHIANYFDLTPEFQREMSRWINEGKITWRNHRARHRERAHSLSQIV